MMTLPSENCVTISICATKIASNHEKSYQVTTWKKIIHTINALLNSGGGRLVMKFKTSPPKGHVKSCVRKIEQKILEFTGTVTLVRSLKIKKANDCMVITVTAPIGNPILTLNFHLYLPTDEQVIEVSSKDPVDKIKEILMTKISSLTPVMPGTHHKDFVSGQEVTFSESRTVQFKNLTSTPTKKVCLAERLVRKTAKILCCISAFANYAGGHIYVGIDDDGKVVGEVIDDKEQSRIREKLAVEVEKMIWPDNGIMGKRWDLFFEKVRDKDGKEVPSTYVIVIFVAQCPGGVFVKAPECYRIVKRRSVEEVDFSTWKRMFLPCLRNESVVISEETNDDLQVLHNVYQTFSQLLHSKCTYEQLEKECVKQESIHRRVDVKLICLAQMAKYLLRKGKYDEAEKLMAEYRNIEPSPSFVLMFEVVEDYLRCLEERSRGQYEESYEIALKSMEKMDKVQSGIICAAFYVLAGTVVNILAVQQHNPNDRDLFLTKANELYDKSIEKLDSVHDVTAAKADLEQKINTNKALLHLGSCLTGRMLGDFIVNVSEAKSCIDKAMHVDFPLSELRDVQYLLALSCMYHRPASGNIDHSVQKIRLTKALKYARSAKLVAEAEELAEMMRYAEYRVSLLENELQAL